MRAWLVKNGVKFAEAFEMDDVWAHALAITFGEFAGLGEWDWQRGAWRDAK